MRGLILFCLFCLTPLQLQASERDGQLLNELCSRAQLLSASALLYFNPAARAPDPRGLTAVYHHLNTLASHIQQLGRPPALMRPLQAMQRSFAELDGLQPDQRQRYPALLSALLQQQEQLQQAASRAYSEAGVPAAPQVALLHQQSRDLASLLRDLQLRHYPWPNGAPVALLGPQALQLDQAVLQRFGQLQQVLPAQQQASLADVRRSYQFVRPMLVEAHTGAQGGAEFYLSRAVLDLDELALSAAAEEFQHQSE